VAKSVLKNWPVSLAGVAVCVMVSCSRNGGDGFPASPDDPPGDNALLERLPIDLAALDYAAMAAKRAAFESDWLPIYDFAQVFPANANRPEAKANPQPTFYAPLGTPVVAIVSGVVASTTRLYSGDTSVMIAAHGGDNAPMWEMEHVIKVRVRAGDHVLAGDTIAEVSDYECVWGRNSNPADPICASGLGLVEIGLLYGGSPPEHRCPFEPQLVAAAQRTALFGQLDSARARIQTAFGDSTKYDKSDWESPQCVSLARVPG
jgi:hypothetical protein